MQFIKNYFSLIKISHTVFALPFAFIGALLGLRDITNNKPILFLFVAVILCMFFARSSAMLFNRIIDLKFDKKNPRTATRELPTGKVNIKVSYILLLINIVLFITTTVFINKTVFYLSFVALFWITFYSYTKRFTYLCHIWLGISLGLSPVGAYLVFCEKFSPDVLLFSAIVVFWVAGFDIIYSLQDIEFDKNNNLYSIPSKFGVKKSLSIALLFHSIAILLAIIIGIKYKFTYIYWIGTILFAIFLLLQHLKIKKADKQQIYKIFSIYNSYAGLLYGIMTIGDLLLTI
ncbi:MAG: putative 4-hydroxybenzoate polyprenyltransferase [Bacteroidales bacterium]|nr:putative 4-hydroxybenzoate polyprenyltransferase [Bacteroidales bacterium]